MVDARAAESAPVGQAPPNPMPNQRGSDEQVLEQAIGRLTRRLAVAADEEIAGLVAERKAMRAELEELRHAAILASGKVRSIDDAKGKR